MQQMLEKKWEHKQAALVRRLGSEQDTLRRDLRGLRTAVGGHREPPPEGSTPQTQRQALTQLRADQNEHSTEMRSQLETLEVSLGV